MKKKSKEDDCRPIHSDLSYDLTYKWVFLIGGLFLIIKISIFRRERKQS